MEDFLAFISDDVKYAIPALSVQEILWLPALTLLDSIPNDIIGIFNYRGEVITIIDLKVKMGGQVRNYTLRHQVIIVYHNKTRLGILVEEVLGLRQFGADVVEPAPAMLYHNQAEELITPYLARLETELLPLINLDVLFSTTYLLPALPMPPSLEQPATALIPAKASASEAFRLFWQNLPESEQLLLLERTNKYRIRDEHSDYVGRLPLMLVRIGKERFGITYEIIRELQRISSVTLVPCCPPHILGQTNLRGEIITLADIRPVLKMPPIVPQSSYTVLIAEYADAVVGFPVDELSELMFIEPSEIRPLPLTMQSDHEAYLKGVILREGATLAVLDAIQILRDEILTVDEEV